MVEEHYFTFNCGRDISIEYWLFKQPSGRGNQYLPNIKHWKLRAEKSKNCCVRPNEFCSWKLTNWLKQQTSETPSQRHNWYLTKKRSRLFTNKTKNEKNSIFIKFDSLVISIYLIFWYFIVISIKTNN